MPAVRRCVLLAVLVGLTAGAGCGGDDPEPRGERPATTATAAPTADPLQVPAEGYTCGELRDPQYRKRQAAAILDERGIRGAERARLERRLTRALFRECDPGPDYRRAADDVARAVLD